MQNKELIKNHYHTVLSYSATARAFGVSRQRVHQIITGYSTAPCEVLSRFKKDACEACGETQRLTIHHIDRNTLNNTENNLITCCRKCHHDFENVSRERLGLPIRTRVFHDFNCKECKKDFRSDNKLRKFCSSDCASFNYKKYKTPEQIEIKKKQDAATRRRYYERNRERLIACSVEWRKNNKEKSKEIARKHYEKHRGEYKYLKEYYEKNRERILAQQKKYRQRRNESRKSKI